MSVCVSVCLSVREHLPNHKRDLYQIFMHVAYRRSSVLIRRDDAKSMGRVNFWGFHLIDSALYWPYSVVNFATKDRFGLNLLIYREVGQNSISYY